MALRWAGWVLCTCLVCYGGAWAQDEKADAAAPVKGDVIELKYGKSLKGVQILRETPKEVEVQTVAGVDPLQIPRGQVANITYDNVDPRVPSQSGGAGADGARPEIMGQELSPEFHEKLTKSLTEEPLKFDNLVLPKIIGEIQRLSSVSDIKVNPSVGRIPNAETKRSFEIAPGTTLLSFLQNDFAKMYPQLTVELRYDAIYINTKEAAPNQ